MSKELSASAGPTIIGLIIELLLVLLVPVFENDL